MRQRAEPWKPELTPRLREQTNAESDRLMFLVPVTEEAAKWQFST